MARRFPASSDKSAEFEYCQVIVEIGNLAMHI